MTSYRVMFESRVYQFTPTRYGDTVAALAKDGSYRRVTSPRICQGVRAAFDQMQDCSPLFRTAAA